MYTVKRRKITEAQTGCSTANLKDQSTQCGSTKGSYATNVKNGNFISFENLLKSYLWCRDFTLSWLKAEGLIARSRICTNCGSEMKRFEHGDRSDGYVWECRKQLNGKLHRCERSI